MFSFKILFLKLLWFIRVKLHYKCMRKYFMDILFKDIIYGKIYDAIYNMKYFSCCKWQALKFRFIFNVFHINLRQIFKYLSRLDKDRNLNKSIDCNRFILVRWTGISFFCPEYFTECMYYSIEWFNAVSFSVFGILTCTTGLIF